MKNIVVAGEFSFTEDQKKRLENLGTVTFVGESESAQQWCEKVQGADIICSDGDYLLENLPNLKNVFVTYPFIELGSFDSQELEKNGVFVANTQGSNRDSIVEWVMFMILSLLRKFPHTLNVTENIPLEFHESLCGKNLLIVGKGSIGQKIGSVSESFGMNVEFFCRGDKLSEKTASADVIVNSLNCNPSSENLLDEEFFLSVKKGAYFISFVRQYTYDLNGLITSLDKDVMAGAAIDCDPESPGDTTNDFYQKIVKHDKILATPHIAFSTQQAKAQGVETVVQNIEAYCAGKPQNILKK